MKKKVDLKNIRLVVLTSTLPRWQGDATPMFVLDHCKLLAPSMKEVIVLAPHYKGSKTKETIGPNVVIKRIRYFLPSRYQNIFYGGDAVHRVSRSPLYLLKVLFYVLATTLTVIRLRPYKNTILNPNWLLPQGFIGLLVTLVFWRTRMITTARGGDIFAVQGRWLAKIKKLILKRSDKVVVNSMQAKKACMKIHQRDYVVAPTGYNASLFKQKPVRNYNLATRQDPTIDVISVGRLSEEKGFIYVLEAVNNTIRRGVSIRLKIAGDGPQRPVLEKYITDNSLQQHVSLLGWVDRGELAELLRKADLFVGASIVTNSGWRESFGNVYAEAMACGTPTIITNTSGASELIMDGDSGFIVKSGSSKEIANVIKYISDHPEKLKSVGTKAAKIIKPYSSDSTKEKYLQLFKDVLGRKE